MCTQQAKLTFADMPCGKGFKPFLKFCKNRVLKLKTMNGEPIILGTEMWKTAIGHPSSVRLAEARDFVQKHYGFKFMMGLWTDKGNALQGAKFEDLLAAAIENYKHLKTPERDLSLDVAIEDAVTSAIFAYKSALLVDVQCNDILCEANAEVARRSPLGTPLQTSRVESTPQAPPRIRRRLFV